MNIHVHIELTRKEYSAVEETAKAAGRTVEGWFADQAQRCVNLRRVERRRASRQTKPARSPR